MKLGKEYALLFSVMFLPGFLSQTGAVDASAWDRPSYHLTLLAIAIPQILLLIYVTELRTPGIARRLGWHAPKMTDAAAFAIAVVFLLGALSVVNFGAALVPDGSVFVESTVSWTFTRYALLPLVVVSSIVVGYREEIFYRAYMFVRGEEMNLHPAIVIGASSVIFAVGHLYQGWAGFLVAFVIGTTFGGVFAWRRSLHGIALAHGLYNTIVLLATGQV